MFATNSVATLSPPLLLLLIPEVTVSFSPIILIYLAYHNG